MKSPIRRRFAAVALFALSALAPAAASAGPYLVFDARTGEVLAENQSFDPWYPASLTKMMTIYVTLRAMASGEVTADKPVVMTARAAKEPPSKTGFKPGTAVTVDTALKLLVVKSANDMAVALGESVAGSAEAFVDRMNAEAARIGMTSTRFANPNGLPDPWQWTTARDYALLTRALMREFPQTRDLFRITALSLGGKIIKTHNHLLERYPGADGMKTGFICSSGFNVVASATRDDRRLVAIVLGEKNAKVRAEHAAELLETAFRTGAGLHGNRATIDTLRPLVEPPGLPADMKPEVCGPKRDAGEDANAEVGADGNTASAALQPTSYLVPAFKVMDPVPISLLAPQPVPAAVPLPVPRPQVSAAGGSDPADAIGAAPLRAGTKG